MYYYYFVWVYIFWGIPPKPPVRKEGNVYYPDFGKKER